MRNRMWRSEVWDINNLFFLKGHVRPGCSHPGDLGRRSHHPLLLRKAHGANARVREEERQGRKKDILRSASVVLRLLKHVFSFSLFYIISWPLIAV